MALFTLFRVQDDHLYLFFSEIRGRYCQVQHHARLQCHHASPLRLVHEMLGELDYLGFQLEFQRRTADDLETRVFSIHRTTLELGSFEAIHTVCSRHGILSPIATQAQL